MLRYLAPLLMLGASAPVSNCLVLGAEVAIGISRYKPQCSVVALAGRSSARISENVPQQAYSVAYVIAGINDPLNPKLGQNLFKIRRKLKAARVVWVAPYPRKAELRVFETATHFHDQVVYLRKFKEDKNNPGRPKDYKALARSLT